MMIATKHFVFRFSDIEVHEHELRVSRGGQALSLEPKAFRVLVYLLRHAGRLVTKSELIDAIWGETAVTDNSLTRVIALLRKVLEDDPRQPRFIETVATVGYRFLCPVEAVEISSDKVEAGSPVIPSLTGIAAGTQSIRNRKPARQVFWFWPLIALLTLVLAWLLRPTLPPPQVTGTTQLTHDGATKFLSEAHTPLVTDGSRIYFHENIGQTTWPMTQVSVEGGETARLEVPLPRSVLADISPDGHALLLGAFPPDIGPVLQLWSVSVDPGTPLRRIGTTMIDWVAATLSPDGKVLYYSLNSDLFASESDGSHPRKLVTIDGDPFWLRVSPDGRLLRFSAINKSGQSSLFEVHTDGTRLRQLFPGFSHRDTLCCGNWTPDGKYFVFESTHEQGSTLWSVREATDLWRKVSHEPVQLTHGEISTMCPLPGKDGGKIFFAGILRRGEVMRYDLKTHALTPFLPGFSASGLDFTKDGKRMVYASFPDGILWQSRIDGADRHQLTFPPMHAGLPRWSPDGLQIAFSGDLPGKPTQVFVIPAGGGTPEQLTFSDEDSSDATWSADGNSLAYAGPWDSEPTKIPLHVLNLRTREVTAVPNSAGLFSPRWSPDGRYLLAEPLGKAELVLYDLNQHSWQPLSETKSAANYPAWTKDGRCVYFNASNLEYRVCLADRKVEQIADMAQSGVLAFTSGGDWTGLAPDGSILALRDTSTEEIYALDVKFP
jgi:Tol biopolymer transport system component/DNA-binding winged helix-turn-helix (wHTH) protein